MTTVEACIAFYSGFIVLSTPLTLTVGTHTPLVMEHYTETIAFWPHRGKCVTPKQKKECYYLSSLDRYFMLEFQCQGPLSRQPGSNVFYLCTPFLSFVTIIFAIRILRQKSVSESVGK